MKRFIARISSLAALIAMSATTPALAQDGVKAKAPSSRGGDPAAMRPAPESASASQSASNPAAMRAAPAGPNPAAMTSNSAPQQKRNWRDDASQRQLEGMRPATDQRSKADSSRERSQR
jgi:hypothetical protein